MNTIIKLAVKCVVTGAASVIGFNAGERVWKDVLEERVKNFLKRFKKTSETKETES